MKTTTSSHNTPYFLHNKQIQLIKEKKSSQTRTRHDQLFKRLIETFFAEFFEAFFPKLHENINFNKLRFLSEEITPNRFDDNTRILDIVAEVKDKKTDDLIVVHVEPQSYVQPNFHKRMLHYFIELDRKVNKPIIPIAIFTYDQPWNKNTYTIEVFGNEIIRFTYISIHLRSLPWRDFINIKNPVVAAFLSKMNYTEEEKIDVNIEFLRMLTKLDINLEQQAIIRNFFQSYIILSEEEEEILMKTIKEQPDADDMLEVTNPFVEYGKRKGIEIGVDRGREEEQINIARKMLTKDYKDEQISDLTGLSQSQINQLRQNNK